MGQGALILTTVLKRWTPRRIGPDLKLWLRADLGITLVSGAVSVWADQSGNGHNFTQTTAANRFTYEPAGFNGKASCFGDSSSVAKVMTGPDNAFSSMTSGEVFIAMQKSADPSVGTGAGGLWQFSTDGQASHVPFTDSNIYDGWGSSLRKATGNPTPSLANRVVYSVRSAPNAWSNYIDGVQHFTTGTNTVAFPAQTAIGGTGAVTAIDGRIAEVIIFKRVLTSAERTRVHTYFTSRYGIAMVAG